MSDLVLVAPLLLGLQSLPVLDPRLLLVVDDLLERQVGDGILVHGYLLFVLQVEQSVLGHNHIRVNIDAVVLRYSLLGVVLVLCKVLLRVLEKPAVVGVVLLLHEALFDDDCEYVGNYTNRNEDVAVEVDLRTEAADLDHVVVGVPNHVSVHESEEGVAADAEVGEASALPKDGHPQEGVPDEQRNHRNESSADERGTLAEASQHGPVALCLQQVSQHHEPGQHCAEAQLLVSHLDQVEGVPEYGIDATHDLKDIC